MSSIGLLRQSLGGSSSRELLLAEEPRELRQIVRALRAEVDHFDPSPSADHRIAAIAAFMRNGLIADPRQLRILSFSVMDIVPSIGKRLLSFPEPFRNLLEAVTALPSLWFRKCYQGLLISYFGGQNAAESEDPAERESWLWLRRFLASGIPRLLALRRIPAWVSVLESRTELLDDEPCVSFASEIADGRMESFEDIRSKLDIPGSSWLLQEAAAAAIKAGCARGDQAFRTCLNNLLDLIERYPLIADNGVASVLRRYAAISAAPESPALLQKAISLWGNPLRRRNLPSWDRAGDAAILMCSTWLKASLIEDFFEHLSADGSAERRRVTFWKRYVPHIDDMYFAFGRNARNDRSQDTKRLRDTMGDRLLRLEGPVARNNAFLMQMGDFVVVEFGLSDNAAFIFKRDNLPFKLESEIRTKGRHSGGRTRGIGSFIRTGALSGKTTLRQASFVTLGFRIRGAPTEIPPIDRRKGCEKRRRLPPCPDMGRQPIPGPLQPAQQSNPTAARPRRRSRRRVWPISAFCTGLDSSSDQKAFFEVSATDQNPELKAMLEHWGFRYEPRTWSWKLLRGGS